MDNSNSIYFDLGFDHIFNKAAIDHILFIVVLCALFTVKDLRKLLLLVTAFTIGHSLTLALAGLDIIRINTRLVELLIPVTIMITAVFNFYTIYKSDENKLIIHNSIHFIMALSFGFIHGMGFSNYLRSTLFPGDSIVSQLLFFNLGIEIGQILIVCILLAIGYIFTSLLKIKMNHWVFTLSGLAFAVSLYLLISQL